MRADILMKCASTVLARALPIVAEEMVDEGAVSSTPQPTGSVWPNNPTLEGELYQMMTDNRLCWFLDILFCTGS
jgi:hypothetical protein